MPVVTNIVMRTDDGIEVSFDDEHTVVLVPLLRSASERLKRSSIVLDLKTFELRHRGEMVVCYLGRAHARNETDRDSMITHLHRDYTVAHALRYWHAAWEWLEQEYYVRSEREALHQDVAPQLRYATDVFEKAYSHRARMLSAPVRVRQVA